MGRSEIMPHLPSYTPAKPKVKKPSQADIMLSTPEGRELLWEAGADVPLDEAAGNAEKITTERVAELRNWDPNWRDTARHWLANAFGGDMAGQRKVDSILDGLDLLPVTGDVSAAVDTVDYAKKGEWWKAAGMGAITAAGVVPGARAALKPVAKGIRAYHGSPHDFDKFSTDFMGTGEGAQAYGDGLYMAEAEAVAREYRDSLSRAGEGQYLRDGIAVDPKTLTEAETLAIGVIREAEGYKMTPIELLGETLSRDWNQEAVSEAKKLLSSGRYGFTPKGRMYETNINATPDEFLDWDKPLSEQTKKVRDAIAAVSKTVKKPGLFTLEPERTMRGVFHDGDFKDVPSFYGQLAARLSGGLSKKNEGLASEALAKAGIKGIRYLDGASRQGGKGTSNYVVFDAENIEILRKFGLAGLIGGGAAAATLAGGGEAKAGADVPLNEAADRVAASLEFPYRPGLDSPRPDPSGNGDFNTELSRTFQINGEWVNVPSLWEGPSGPIDLNKLSDDQMSGFADKFEKATGNKFLRWPSVEDAERAARKRSNEGGAGSPSSRYAK